MSIYGKIKSFEIRSLRKESLTLPKGDWSKETYEKVHDLAEKHDRYIVRFFVNDPRSKNVQIVNSYIPKDIIKYNLIEIGSYIDCSSDSCCFKIAGVDEYFDRHYIMDTQIHDVREKSYRT